MATVYAPPTEIGNPPDTFSDEFKDENGRWDFRAVAAAEEAWIKQLQDAARKANTGDLVGEIIRFGVADGYAQYVVWKQKPLQLIHLAVGDAWTIPEAHERGLRLTDVRQKVEQSRAYGELFGKSKIA